MKKRHSVLVIAVSAASALAVGCSTAAPSASSAQYKRITVVIVSGPVAGVFANIKSGAEQAGRDLNVNVQYTAPKDLNNIAPDLTQLEDAALNRKPDAIVVGEFIPDAQDPGIKKMISAGIPVVFSNAGPNWQSLGGVTFVGEDPNLTGQIAGNNMVKAGSKHGLCVNHVPGNPTTEARCQGFIKAMQGAGQNGTLLSISANQGTNATAFTQSIAGALRADPSIDSVFTLGGVQAEYAIQATATAGESGKTRVGTVDLTKNILNYVQTDKVLFGIDQQPYLEGYYAVLVAAQKVRTGLQPIGEVHTAPLVVTKANVNDVITFSKQPGLWDAA